MASSDTHPTVCPDCGADVPAGAKVCLDCRARLDSSETLGDAVSRRDTVIEPKILDQLKARDAEAERQRSKAPRPAARPRRRRASSADGRPPGSKEPREDPATSKTPPRRVDAARRGDEAGPRRGLGDRADRPLVRPRSRAAVRGRESEPRSGRDRAADSVADRARPDTDESVDVAAKARRLQAEQPARAAAQAPPVRRDPSDTLDLPGRSGDAPPGTLGLIAAEIEEAIEGGLGFGARVDLADKLSIVSSLAVAAGTLLPWSGAQMGIFVGATPLWLFASAALTIVVLRQRLLGFSLDEDEIDEAVTEAGDRAVRVRRLNLLQILNAVGAVAYVVIVAVGLYLQDPRHLNLRFGWFVTLFFAMGLAYSGIARFVSDALQQRQS